MLQEEQGAGSSIVQLLERYLPSLKALKEAGISTTPQAHVAKVVTVCIEHPDWFYNRPRAAELLRNWVYMPAILEVSHKNEHKVVPLPYDA